MKVNTEGVILDFGGTLDSRGEHWYHVISRAYAEEGATLYRKAYIYGERNVSSLLKPDDTMLDLLRKKVMLQLSYTGSDVSPERIAERCYENAKGCIEELRPALSRTSLRYPLVIVSNFYGNLEAVLRDYGIRDLFRGVVDSAIAGVRKPDPAIFRLGLDILGLPPSRVVVIGDSVSKDIIPAASLGCATVLVEGRGWDESESQPHLPSGTVRVSSLSPFLDTL